MKIRDRPEGRFQKGGLFLKGGNDKKNIKSAEGCYREAVSSNQFFVILPIALTTYFF
jgi:hypothetical protein